VIALCVAASLLLACSGIWAAWITWAIDCCAGSDA